MFLRDGPTISCKWFLNLVVGLCCSYDGLFNCDMLRWLFFLFLTPVAFNLILISPILFGCRFSNLFGSTIRRLRCKKDKWCHRQRQYKSWSTARKLKMKSWTLPCLPVDEDMKHLLAWVFDYYRILSISLWHPDSRLNRIDRILIPPRYTFFSGSPTKKNFGLSMLSLEQF
jgi:hypothetical protein